MVEVTYPAKYATSPKAKFYHWIGPPVCHGAERVHNARCGKRVFATDVKPDAVTDAQHECFKCWQVAEENSKQILLAAQQEIRRRNVTSWGSSDMPSIQFIADFCEGIRLSGGEVAELRWLDKGGVNVWHYTAAQVALRAEDRADGNWGMVSWWWQR